MRILIPTNHPDPKGHRAALMRNIATGRGVSGGTFDYPAVAIGTAGPATIYYDPSLGAAGLALARQILSRAAALSTSSGGYFGLMAPSYNVVIAAINGATDGSAGAYHYGCDFVSGGTLYIDANFGHSEMVGGLLVAELVECFMGLQNKGWGCGFSNGEALSRLLAELQSGGPRGTLLEYATGPSWIAAGMPDWINQTEETDQNPVSTGCVILWMYYLKHLGYYAAQIAQAGCPDGTPASCWQALTGKAKTTALPYFMAAIEKIGPSNIVDDDPWLTT